MDRRRRPLRWFVPALGLAMLLPAIPAASAPTTAATTATAAATTAPETAPEPAPTTAATTATAAPGTGPADVGATSMQLPGGVTATFEAPTSDCEVVLDDTAAGPEAARELDAGDLSRLAARYDRTSARLRAQLRADDSLHVTACGELFYVDHLDAPADGSTGAPADGSTDAPGDGPTDASADAPGDASARRHAAAPPFPLADTFKLHSRPGSERTIYLDLDGHTLTGTAWNADGMPDGTALSSYSLDGSSAFSDAERTVIQDIWQHVAEDFAPFDVNVTTEDPGAAALTRSGPDDDAFGIRAVVTRYDPTAHVCVGCSGMAFVNVFARTSNHLATQAALIFTANMHGQEGVAQVVADTISHEVGHTLNLGHHGDASSQYAFGQGMWSPLMGSGPYPLSTWSNGDYKGATLPSQKDVEVIASHGAPLMADDHGGEAATATAVTVPSTTAGVIEHRDDTDWFRFTTTGETVLTAAPAATGPNLDIELTLVAADGTSVVATANPPSAWPHFGRLGFPPGTPVTGLDATITRTLPAGTYHARVRGVGAGNPAVDGYSDYGSLGRYTLAVSADGVAPPPGTAPTVSITSGPASVTTQRTARFVFAAVPAAGSTFTCSLDGAAYAACSSPRELAGLGDGEHTFAVRATRAGATSAPVTRRWTVDGTAPKVTIGGTPAQGATTSSRAADLTFAADEPIAGWEFRLDGGTWQTAPPGVGGVGISGLQPGARTFELRARDLAGNLGSATRNWTITDGSTTPPPKPGPKPPKPGPKPPAGGPSFGDVGPGHPHAATIAILASREVTLGCAGGRNFCPDEPVSRDQMATFLTRALELAPGSASPPFTDVKAGSTHARAIDAMRREAITLGCGGPRYCPGDPVSRDQMATFLMRALELAPGSASPPFVDVGAGTTHAKAIDAMRREKITLGCGGPRYCPNGEVTRAQMASFLVRALEW